MEWNRHDSYEGTHAFLSASQHSWLSYNDEKLKSVFKSQFAKQRGTELHELAHDLIRFKQKLPRQHITFNMFVNDAIGFKMDSEILLFYSPNCYGTADAILYDKKKRILRIHDLKTGTVVPGSMKQLQIYTALFCLEYGVNPNDLELIELRIYQNDDVVIEDADPIEILHIMDRIVAFDKIIEEIKDGLDTW